MDKELKKELEEISEKLEESNELLESILEEILMEKYSRWSPSAQTAIILGFMIFNLSLSFHLIGERLLSIIMLFGGVASLLVGGFKLLRD